MASHQESVRPPLDQDLSSEELLRWYWLKSELVSLARSLQISPSGGKQELTSRIAAALDGTPYEAPERITQSSVRQLSKPLSRETIVPKGQRCTQVLRQWFEGEIGKSFRFDAAMREHFVNADGTSTLGDAVTHWHTSRHAGPTEIGEQFELNRFTRAWHNEHPQGSKEDLKQAWNQYRATPVDVRGRA